MMCWPPASPSQVPRLQLAALQRSAAATAAAHAATVLMFHNPLFSGTPRTPTSEPGSQSASAAPTSRSAAAGDASAAGSMAATPRSVADAATNTPRAGGACCNAGVEACTTADAATGASRSPSIDQAAGAEACTTADAGTSTSHLICTDGTAAAEEEGVAPGTSRFASVDSRASVHLWGPVDGGSATPRYASQTSAGTGASRRSSLEDSAAEPPGAHGSCQSLATEAAAPFPVACHDSLPGSSISGAPAAGWQPPPVAASAPQAQAGLLVSAAAAKAAPSIGGRVPSLTALYQAGPLTARLPTTWDDILVPTETFAGRLTSGSWRRRRSVHSPFNNGSSGGAEHGSSAMPHNAASTAGNSQGDETESAAPPHSAAEAQAGRELSPRLLAAAAAGAHAHRGVAPWPAVDLNASRVLQQARERSVGAPGTPRSLRRVRSAMQRWYEPARILTSAGGAEAPDSDEADEEPLLPRDLRFEEAADGSADSDADDWEDRKAVAGACLCCAYLCCFLCTAASHHQRYVACLIVLPIVKRKGV